MFVPKFAYWARTEDYFGKEFNAGKYKKLYFRYLGAAFGSSMISCIYGMVDVAVVGQYQGPQGTAALSIVAPIWTILYSLGILTGSGGSIKELVINNF